MYLYLFKGIICLCNVSDSFKVAGFEGGFEEPTLHPDPEALLAKYTRELNENQVLCSYQKLKGQLNFGYMHLELAQIRILLTLQKQVKSNKPTLIEV